MNRIVFIRVMFILILALSMLKHKWTRRNKIINTIITIWIIVCLIIIIYFVYFQPVQEVDYDHAPTASAISKSFTNPGDGNITSNGGGWVVSIAAISNREPWSKVIVRLENNKQTMAEMLVMAKQPNSYWNNNVSDGPKWYAQAFSGPMYYSHNGAGKSRISTAMTVEDFVTLENAYFIVVDNNGNGYFDRGDFVHVYKSHNGDTLPEIVGLNYTLRFVFHDGETICTSNLE